MTCTHFELNGFHGIVCTSDSTKRTIDVDGALYTFEFDDRFGPEAVRCGRFKLSTGPDLDEKHPFWKALSLWCGGGKRMDGNRCVYEMDTVALVQMFSNRQGVVVGYRPRRKLSEPDTEIVS